MMNVESAFNPALKVAFMVMLGGVGRLRLCEDDVRVYGTDKEPSLRIAEDSFYRQMAADFASQGRSVGENVWSTTWICN
ncbi:hypothetical protein KSS87_012895 [Heliosperma pusillum]|nr:hypothetical protein KSS87_012895 [Heliosperma pusillum]